MYSEGQIVTLKVTRQPGNKHHRPILVYSPTTGNSDETEEVTLDSREAACMNLYERFQRWDEPTED